MAKTKRKDHKKNESERGYIRELEKQVRSYQKKLRQYEKYEQRGPSDEIVNDSEDTDKELLMVQDCNVCGKGKMVETLNLGAHGVFGCCNVCETRGKMK